MARMHLAVDLGTLTEEMLAEALARQRQPDRFAGANQAGGDSLELVPFAVVTFISESRGRLWVGLKATLVDRGGKQLWTISGDSMIGGGSVLDKRSIGLVPAATK